MFSKQSKLRQSSSTVHFSNKGIFHFEGKPFKIFPSKSKNPKAPQLAILDLEGNERISGLFKISPNKYQGDVKTEKGHKEYFSVEQKGRDTLVLEGFREALLIKGVITPDDENEGLKGDYSPLETVLEGVEAPEDNQLNITGEPI